MSSALIGWIIAALIVIGGGAYFFTNGSHGAMQSDHMVGSSTDTMASSTDHMMASTSDSTMHDDGTMMNASTSVDAMMH